METNRHTRRQLRLQGTAFAVLFLALIGLLAWLSTRYHYQADWTATHRHTLSAASTELLKRLDGPIQISAFARPGEATRVRQPIRDLVRRYQRRKPDITLTFVDPDMEPAKVRQAGVTLDGELVVEYAGRRQNVQTVSEQALTNALQRLARQGERRIVFLRGHGERNPEGKANYDLGAFGRQLKNKGFDLVDRDLAAHPAIPPQTAVLVIAGPQTDLLPGEVAILQHYLDDGGNLLWLGDPGPLHGLDPLAKRLGIGFRPGVIVDPTTELLRIKNPAFAVVSRYPDHPVTRGLASVSLFPRAAALAVDPPKGWKSSILLRTVARSWSETGTLNGTVNFDRGKDLPGPLAVGVALTRKLGGKAGTVGRIQRVVVLGDGDFLSNTYLGNGANLELGNRLLNWLSHDDRFITIPPKPAPDTRLTLSTTVGAILGFGFLFLLPGVLLAGGWMLRRRRRRR
jgi:ABC-type uncharacterized transport system involved in gliding motility auxiliary subunit